MGVKEGDFVLLDYTGSTDGKVFDTTVEGAAKKNSIYIKEQVYKPLVIVAGKGDLIPGLDNALIGMEKGGEKKLTIPPEEAYGPRDPKLIKIVPLKIFTDNKLNPFPGMPVQLDNMTARVQSVSGGRVRVDFNHELAGRTLDFEIKLVDVLAKTEEKVRALASQFFGEKDLKLELKGKKVIATPKTELLATKRYGQAKAYFITQVTSRLPEMSVEFVEEYKKA
ncbi:MAG: peptidylprolyl isomerase [Candidatus Diapherotrites archaeon]|nr:peptidylprolyl isomerase [Candidatus Diapherotrites archaeon]